MKKSFYRSYCAPSALFWLQDAEERKEVAAFTDKISSFIEADQIDSLRFYYLMANFDSLRFAVTEKPPIRGRRRWKVESQISLYLANLSAPGDYR